MVSTNEKIGEKCFTCTDCSKVWVKMIDNELARALAGLDVATADKQQLAVLDGGTRRQDLSKDLLLILFKGLNIQELALVLLVSRCPSR